MRQDCTTILASGISSLKLFESTVEALSLVSIILLLLVANGSVIAEIVKQEKWIEYKVITLTT